jgi:uncharacterized membrane protein
MKKYLIAGLITLLPLILTIMIFVFLIDLFTAPFLSLFIDVLSKYSNNFPILKSTTVITAISRILIIIMLIIFIFILGVLARWFFIRSLINLTNKILSKIPLVKSVYKTLKDIISSFMAQERKAFTKTIMVPFPSEESYCIAFESGEIPKECQDKIKEKLKPVFVPTAPHPISGYLIMVPADKLNDIEMKNEDAVKFTVSCGLILPGDKENDKIKK